MLPEVKPLLATHSTFVLREEQSNLQIWISVYFKIGILMNFRVMGGSADCEVGLVIMFVQSLKYLLHFPSRDIANHLHRHLQSCVGTQARLGHAAFDAQLWKAYFVTTPYAIHTSVHAYA